ncbi:hypothetical protein MBLNU457_g0072t1 [Dothideomycetes sp. NU457]
MTFVATILAALKAPGKRQIVQEAAPTQAIPTIKDEGEKKESVAVNVDQDTASTHDAKYDISLRHGRLDRWLDIVVCWSGSGPVFFFIMAFLFGWAFAGIHFYNDIDWQVSMSDIQAIVSYMFDSLLMRQQLNSHDESLLVAAQLRSRAVSHRRMLAQIVRAKAAGEQLSIPSEDVEPDFNLDLPAESWFGRMITRFAVVVGHIVTIGLYWAAIVVWLAFGPANGFSNEWQLYINSATSALMVFVFSFLANIRERHSKYTRTCLETTFLVDTYLERRLRQATLDTIPNDVVIIEPPKVNFLQRAIYYYADVVGTLVGIALLLIVMIAWLAIGPVLHFNDNWWLLIGTYAGLIGLNDGFVLRNVQAKLQDFETAQFAHLETDDEGLLAIINETPVKTAPGPVSLSSRISLAVGKFCAHEMTVLAGVLVIFALVAASSAMRWSTTGQLVSNVPPSIIESFFMIILITGHNFADSERRAQIKNMYERRLKLVNWLRAMERA